MEVILDKSSLLNSIKIVEKITAQKGVNPVLSNILFETNGDEIKLSATDLSLTITTNMKAQIEKQGAITLNAKKLSEIISKLDNNKPIKLTLDEDSYTTTISSGNAEFNLIGISPEEFPKTLEEKTQEEISFEISSNTLIKGVKQVVYSAAINESATILSGVCLNINSNTLEIVSTDGNRLTKASKPINSKEQDAKFVVPSRTIQELIRIASSLEDEKIVISLIKSKIEFAFKNVIFQSKLINGDFPKYDKLIPTNNETEVIIKTDELIEAIERVCTMANERTNIVKFNFDNGSLELSTDTPESGSAQDKIDIEINNDNELIIAFNYKYVLDSLKNMESKKVKIEIATALSATLFKPYDENDTELNQSYICLIMPVQVR